MLLPGILGLGVLNFCADTILLYSERMVQKLHNVSDWICTVCHYVFVGMGIVFGGLFYLIRGTIRSTDGWSWGEFFFKV